MKEINTSELEAKSAKKLVVRKRILTSPEPISGKKFSVETEILVHHFYEDDDVSRLMASLNGFVSVKQEDRSRKQNEKRLVLCNLAELFQRFQTGVSEAKIGFYTFAQLIPRHCVLVGASGTHSVSVCVHLENVNLMMDSMGFEHLTENCAILLKDYHDGFKLITCKDPSEACLLERM